MRDCLWFLQTETVKLALNVYTKVTAVLCVFDTKGDT